MDTEQLKTCTQCGAEKSAVCDFYKGRANCKECFKQSARDHRKTNKYKATHQKYMSGDGKKVRAAWRTTDNGKKYIKKNNQSEAKKRSVKKYNESEQGKARVKRANSSLSHKLSVEKYLKTENNKQRVKRGNAKTYVKRRNDPSMLLEHNLLVKLRHQITGARHESATLRRYTGFSSRDDMLTHMESLFTTGMSFSNYGRYGWHIGHRIPQVCYDHTNIEDVHRCWSKANLFPQWGKENLQLGTTLPSPDVLESLRDYWPAKWNGVMP